MDNDAAPQIPPRQNSLRKSILPISSQCCLWFAWAPNGFVGPKGEGAASRPVFEVKPLNAVHLKISVNDKTQKWGHNPDPNRASGANGLDGSNGTVIDSRGLEMPEYQSTTYNSQYINSISTHLNKLVMILEYDGGHPTADQHGIQEIVPEGQPFTIDPRVTGVFIGMHDGYEWNNNSGEIQVTVDWS